MVRIKAHELRKKKKGDLVKQLEELKTELTGHRVAQVTGGAATRLSAIKVAKKNIARVLTVISQTQRQQLRTYFRNQKYTPLDLRAKKTRAIRRRLSKSERSARTIRQQKKAAAFPYRKFAIKA